VDGRHRRAAKKRWRIIEFTRGRSKREPLYRELIKITRATPSAKTVVYGWKLASSWRALSTRKEPVIPPKSNRTAPRAYDETLYAQRSLIANFFCKLKRVCDRRRPSATG
jgi:hypothetical protein